MTNRTDIVSPDALRVLTHALEKLRAREGLTGERLDNNHSVEATPLLALAAVRRYADVHDVGLAQAALDVIKECIRESLNGSQRIVADAVLGHGVFSEPYISHGTTVASSLRCIQTCSEHDVGYCSPAGARCMTR
jgi:hypothetical protein